MRGVRSVVAAALLVLLALPHSMVRGEAPRGKRQYWICGHEKCSDRTSHAPDPEYPEYCRNGHVMNQPAYRA